MFWEAQDLAQLPVEMKHIALLKFKVVIPQEHQFASVIVLNAESSPNVTLRMKMDHVLDLNALMESLTATEMA